MFGIRPYSNLFHAIWTTLAFVVFLAVWLFWDINLPLEAYEVPQELHENISFVGSMILLAPTATIIFAILAGGLWVASWVDHQKAIKWAKVNSNLNE